MTPMHATTRKTLRDLRRQAAQVAAVLVTIMLGVGLFIASAGAFRNLSGSYGLTYDRLHFADTAQQDAAEDGEVHDEILDVEENVRTHGRCAGSRAPDSRCASGRGGSADVPPLGYR